MMKRITFGGMFCDIAQCSFTPGGPFCKSGTCSQRQVWERLKAIEDTLGDEYDLDHLRDLLRAEKDGRLVALPCKVGDTVYGIKPFKKADGCLIYEIKHGAVLAFKVLENGVFCMVSAEEQFGYPVAWSLEDFGKTVFLTREEAEAALAEKGGGV